MTTTTKMNDTMFHLEELVFAEGGYDSEDMRERINRLARATLCWYEYNVYQRLLLTKPCDATYTQLIYQLIPDIIKEEDEIEKVVKGLLGENFETEEECLFTKELRDEVYNDLLQGGGSYCSCFGEDERHDDEDIYDYPYDGNPDSDSD